MIGLSGLTDDQRIGLKRRINRIFTLLFLFLCFFFFMNWIVEGSGTWTPDYPQIDLHGIINQKELSEENYHTLFLQTGLGKEAVDELWKIKVGDNRERVFEQYQNKFFSSKDYVCRLVATIVYEERFRDKKGNPVKGFNIPDLKNGDILITKSTHSLGWRHGHAAIVTDASTGETLEAIVLGNPSDFQNISKWETYPTFIQLRLKDDPKMDAEKIAKYAKESICGISYGLVAGIPKKAPDIIKKTQCAHLVWYPYMHFGYDIDSNGSWLVIPKDIANSDYFQVVQVYGVNPEEIWP